MFLNTIFKRLIFTLVFLIVSLFLFYIIFNPLFTSTNLIINLPSGSFNICAKYPDLWNKLKLLYLLFFVLSNLIYSNMIYPLFFSKNEIKVSEVQKLQMQDLHLNITNNSVKTPIIIPKEGLYQNILITGTIRYWKNQFCNVPLYKAINGF